MCKAHESDTAKTLDTDDPKGTIHLKKVASRKMGDEHEMTSHFWIHGSMTWCSWMDICNNGLQLQSHRI